LLWDATPPATTPAPHATCPSPPPPPCTPTTPPRALFPHKRCPPRCIALTPHTATFLCHYYRAGHDAPSPPPLALTGGTLPRHHFQLLRSAGHLRRAGLPAEPRLTRRTRAHGHTTTPHVHTAQALPPLPHRPHPAHFYPHTTPHPAHTFPYYHTGTEPSHTPATPTWFGCDLVSRPLPPTTYPPPPNTCAFTSATTIIWAPYLTRQ